MAVIQPWNAQLRDPDSFNITGTVSGTSIALDFRKSTMLFVHVIWASATNTGTTFKVEGSEDPLAIPSPGSAAWVTMVNSNAYGTATVTAGVLTIPSASAGSEILIYANVPSFVRYNYVVTTGGGNIKVYTMGRAT